MGNYITISSYTFVRFCVVITKIQTKNFEPKYTIKIYEVFFTGSLGCCGVVKTVCVLWAYVTSQQGLGFKYTPMRGRMAYARSHSPVGLVQGRMAQCFARSHGPILCEVAYRIFDIFVKT